MACVASAKRGKNSARKRLVRALTHAPWLAVLGVWLFPYGAGAATLSGGVGFDYASWGGGQVTRDALGFATLAAGRGDATAALARFDDTIVGPGVSGIGNVGFAVRGPVRARVIGARMVGDESFRAWRVRAGPELALAHDVGLALYYARYDDNISDGSHLVGGEVSVPVRPGLGAQAGAGYGNVPGGPSGGQGTLELTWNAMRRLQILGGVGIGRNLIVSSGAASTPTRGILGGLPLIGGEGRGNRDATALAENEVVHTASLGIRILVP